MLQNVTEIQLNISNGMFDAFASVGLKSKSFNFLSIKSQYGVIKYNEKRNMFKIFMKRFDKIMKSIVQEVVMAEVQCFL